MISTEPEKIGGGGVFKLQEDTFVNMRSGTGYPPHWNCSFLIVFFRQLVRSIHTFSGVTFALCFQYVTLSTRYILFSTIQNSRRSCTSTERGNVEEPRLSSNARLSNLGLRRGWSLGLAHYRCLTRDDAGNSSPRR